MKKALSFFAALIMVLATVPFSYGALKTGTYKVKNEVAYIYAQPSALSDSVGEITQGKFVEITEVKNNFGYAFFSAIGAYGWVDMNTLTAVTVPDDDTDITGITVTPPDKTEFVHDEETLDLTGMRVYAVHEDGSSEEITGYSVYADSFSTTGEKTVTVAYTPAGTSVTFSDQFTVNVIPLPITGFNITKLPDKTVYKEHETVDLTGMEATVVYSDRPAEVYSCDEITEENGFTLSVGRDEKLEPGEITVTLNYKYSNVKTEFSITVNKRVLTNLEITQQPDSLVTYSTESTPDITGLRLLATYDNGETEELKDWGCGTVTCDPSSFILGIGNEVTVSYKGKSVTLYYTLAQNTPKGLYIVTPTVMTFRRGYEIDLSGLRVYLEYQDGTIEQIKDYTMSEIDPSTDGIQNIVVKWKDYSDVFSVFISSVYGLGDINGSGKVDVTDARLALRAAIGLVKTAGLTLTASDIDGNGKTDVGDARMILRAAIKLEDFDARTKVILP